MKIRWILPCFVLLLFLAACGAAQTAEEDLPPLDPQAPPAQELSTSTPEVSDMPVETPPLQKFVDLAKKDLVDRLQVDATSINLARSEEVLWPNAALGCPEPGKTYAQGRVPGFRIWLEAGGAEYDYHTDWLGQVILCTDPGLDLDASYPTSTGPTPQIGVPID